MARLSTALLRFVTLGKELRFTVKVRRWQSSILGIKGHSSISMTGNPMKGFTPGFYAFNLHPSWGWVLVAWGRLLVSKL